MTKKFSCMEENSMSENHRRALELRGQMNDDVFWQASVKELAEIIIAQQEQIELLAQENPRCACNPNHVPPIVCNTHRYSQPTPEPRDVPVGSDLDRLVCEAMDCHLRSDTARRCLGPENVAYNGCFPWSTSELGVGTMLNFLKEKGYTVRLTTSPTGGHMTYGRSSQGGGQDGLTIASTPQPALSRCISQLAKDGAL